MGSGDGIRPLKGQLHGPCAKKGLVLLVRTIFSLVHATCYSFQRVLRATVDGKNQATPRAPGAPTFIKIRVLDGFEESGGAWGHHQSTRDEKIPWGSYFRGIWLEL